MSSLLLHVRHHLPTVFAMARWAWWLLRWRRRPPHPGRAGQNLAQYRSALQTLTAEYVRQNPPRLRVRVCLHGNAQTPHEALERSIASLRAQSWPAQSIVCCGGLALTGLPQIATVDELDRCQDDEFVLHLPAGAVLEPMGLAALSSAFALHPQMRSLVPDCLAGEEGALYIRPWVPFQPRRSWAWRGPGESAGLADQGQQAQVARLPAPLVIEPDLPARQSAQLPVRADSRASLSVVVPTRDGGEVLRRCLQAIIAEFQHLALDAELLVVDNGSRDPLTLSVLEGVAAAHPHWVRVLNYDHPFNYAAINNWAVRQAEGDQLLLLNDDVEAQQRGWLAALRDELAADGVSAVGARLLYPSGAVQHAGIALGLGGVAGHPGRGLRLDDPRWHMWPHQLRRQVSAVTGACLLTTRALYWQVNGLNEQALSVAFNDVDFCLKLGSAGQAVVYTPAATLIHHESLSRGAEDTLAKQQRFAAEIRYMQQHWSDVIADDPFYSPHLSLELDDLSFRPPSVSTVFTPRPLASAIAPRP